MKTKIARRIARMFTRKTYRVIPKYRPIPAQRKSMWRSVVGSGSMAELIYRD